jgi:hypothetical protein
MSHSQTLQNMANATNFPRPNHMYICQNQKFQNELITLEMELVIAIFKKLDSNDSPPRLHDLQEKHQLNGVSFKSLVSVKHNRNA